MFKIGRTAALVATAILMSLGIGATPSAAQQQTATIATPHGGDCVQRGGVWQGVTCTFNGGLDVQANQALIVQGNATLVVRGQFVNFGTVGVAENGTLVVGNRTPFVNYGAIVIVPTPGFLPPRFSNYGDIQNFGTIFNANREGIRGIFNNYLTITNPGSITNNGFLLNAGPPTQPAQARIDNVADGLLTNQGGGQLRNEGIITGPVF